MKQETTENQQMAVTVLDDYSVIVSHDEELQGFFTDGKNLDALYGVIEAKAKGLVADPTTKDGASQIKGAARQLASVRVKVDNLGKQVVAELKKLPGVIDDNRKAFREKMEALQEEIRRPVTEIEERKAKVDGFKEIHMKLAAADSATLQGEIERLKAMEFSEETWKESTADAIRTVEAEVNALTTLKAAAEKREEEARELEELRKKQEEADRIIREQKIKEEAERKAKEEAEARAEAERERHRKEMERAEREKEEAERKAVEAEKARQDAEEKARNAKDAMERASIGAQQAVTPMSKTLPQPKPSKWTDEQKAVNKRIVADLAKILPLYIAGHSEQGYELAAREIVKAIVNGKINNLKVEY